MEYNFEIVESYDYGQSSPYDAGSVMHYGPYAFAKDKTKKTIDSLFGATIGQSLQLSDADVELAKSLYDCGTGSKFQQSYNLPVIICETNYLAGLISSIL
jgi:hypothetical protein